MTTALQAHNSPTLLGISPLNDTLKWFKEAVQHPTPATLQVQMGVHFEEVTEMLDQLSGESVESAMRIMEAQSALKSLADHMKSVPGQYTVAEEDRQEMLDALCDQLVTGTGTAHMLGFEIIGALNEVNRSNYSKFVDGKATFTDKGKIAKGPDYFKPDLSPFI